MKKRSLSAIGLGAAFGLALLIQPGQPTTAHAAQKTNEASAATYEVKGRLVNIPSETSCTDAANTRICSFDIKGIGVSDNGELIERHIIGTRHGTADGTGEVSPNRSYAVWKYPDASTMLLRSEGQSTVKADGQRVISGTQTCIDGTGRFANVDCTIDWSHTKQPNGLSAGAYSGTVTPKTQS